MKKIREIIRLAQTVGMSRRQIAKALDVSRPSVDKYLGDFYSSQLSYSQVEAMSDSELLAVFERKDQEKGGRYQALVALFPHFVKELKRTGVTLQLLWEEYRRDHPDGFQYSQFCYHFQIFRESLEVSMHLDHKAGEAVFVDYAGDRLEIRNPITGESTPVEVFVAILASSQLTYVEATPSQTLEDWVRSNERALRFFGGVPRLTVIDNLKSGVTISCRYEPGINSTFDDFAHHYGTVILPARAARPKDKALVESAVKLMYQRIYARLRDRVFFSIEELNQAIRELLELHNNTAFQRLRMSRRELFEETERHQLQPLPIEPFALKEYRMLKVQCNYHIEIRDDRHFYSVPWYLKGKTVKVAYDDRVVTIHYDNVRIAQHLRDRTVNGYSTLPEHMPKEHRFQSDWSAERFLGWAKKLGDSVEKVIAGVIASKDHPEQAFRTCLGILNLTRKHDLKKLLRACEIAHEHRMYSYRRIVNILECGLVDQGELDFNIHRIPSHENIRGSHYYA